MIQGVYNRVIAWTISAVYAIRNFREFLFTRRPLEIELHLDGDFRFPRDSGRFEEDLLLPTASSNGGGIVWSMRTAPDVSVTG